MCIFIKLRSCILFPQCALLEDAMLVNERDNIMLRYEEKDGQISKNI
jgi:hypothetical protein